MKVLDDLCRLVDGEPLQFLRIKSLSPTFTLELIESILINGGSLFVGHTELTQVLRSRLMPLTVRYLSERHNFSQTVRVSRILLVCLKRYMSLLTAESEMALVLLTHLLEPDGTAPWKRILCMEFFRALYAEPGLVRLIYSLYDGKEGRKDILRDHMASLVRLASEKPTLIGVGKQSTVPTRAENSRSITDEQITLEAGGVAGVIGTTVPSTETNVPGVSSQWSVIRTPYMESLDKTDAPPPPETYIYSLVLNCISTFSEGLARFILPLTVSDFKSKRKNRVASPEIDPNSSTASLPDQQTASKHAQNQGTKKSPIPTNPLDLDSHPQHSAIKTCAGIIEHCWPAVLATCSTFLYAALDDEFYHTLVRSFQKLAHVAGLLRLSVPRDAFLTTLGKAATPPDSGNIKPATSIASAPDFSNNNSPDKKRKGAETALVGSPLPVDASNASSESSSILLSTRNLLCLRALLNLGIALGPTLDQPAWSIIFETLQDTDLLIGISSVPAAKYNSTGDAMVSSGTDVPKANLGAEITAVQSASSKMLESSGGYPSDSFHSILVALLNLSRFTEEASHNDAPEKLSITPNSPQSARRSSGHMRKGTRRVSLTVGKSKTQDEQLKFVLERADELAKANLERLSSLDENDLRAWNSLTDSLISSAAHGEVSHSLRLRASEVLNNLVFQTMKEVDNDNDSLRNARQLRNLHALKKQTNSLYSSRLPGSYPTVIADIHEQTLDILKNVLEQYAETFVDGWALVFDLISSVFGEVLTEESTETSISKKGNRPSLLSDSPRLIRAAYSSLQLVASDFLALLPAPCRLELVDSLSSFASQQQDFNISLTTTSSFWNVSDFLQGQIDRFTVESHVDASVKEETLAALAIDEDASVSRNSLWLLLLLRIVDLAVDSRPEIRNCAVHTLLRIFDAYGQQLSPKAWRLCLNRIIFKMVENIHAEIAAAMNKGGDTNSDDFKPWIETAVVMIKGSSELITTFFDSIVGDEEFDLSWGRLLNYFKLLIGLGLLEFSEAVFASLSNILRRIQSPGGFGKQALESTWSLWVDGHPASREDLLNLDMPNQDSALAYLRTFEQLYRLHKHDITQERIVTILEHLRTLVWNSVSPRYSPDIDRSSSVQSLVIDLTKSICMDKEDSQPDVLRCIADFVDSPLSRWEPGSDSRRPTFVAFSKRAIDLLRWYIIDFGIKKEVFADGSLATALKHLSKPVTEKYEWKGKDKEPRLWQKATTNSLDILEVIVPYVEKNYQKADEQEVSRFWECVVDIARGIVSARGYRTQQLSMTETLADETFDIAAFQRLKCLIIPSLGASVIADNYRRDFACALFDSSFVQPPQRFDVPTRETLATEPLKGIYDIRPGRTFDPPPNPRSRMAYVLLDALFELASVPPDDKKDSNGPKDQQTQSARVSLARSVSPYLVLRSAVSLRTFIADQPLRGLMPQPAGARKALIHLLHGMVELNSEPNAVPRPPTAAQTTIENAEQASKNHLEWIYPLVVKAVQVAGKERDDGEVLQMLGRVLQEVGRCASI